MMNVTLQKIAQEEGIEKWECTNCKKEYPIKELYLEKGPASIITTCKTCEKEVLDQHLLDQFEETYEDEF